MINKYIKPEIKIISFSDCADVIQTSGMSEVPKYTIGGVEETLANYGTNGFSIFNPTN